MRSFNLFLRFLQKRFLPRPTEGFTSNVGSAVITIIPSAGPQNDVRSPTPNEFFGGPLGQCVNLVDHLVNVVSLVNVVNLVMGLNLVRACLDTVALEDSIV